MSRQLRGCTQLGTLPAPGPQLPSLTLVKQLGLEHPKAPNMSPILGCLLVRGAMWRAGGQDPDRQKTRAPGHLGVRAIDSWRQKGNLKCLQQSFKLLAHRILKMYSTMKPSKDHNFSVQDTTVKSLLSAYRLLQTPPHSHSGLYPATCLSSHMTQSKPITALTPPPAVVIGFEVDT